MTGQVCLFLLLPDATLGTPWASGSLSILISELWFTCRRLHRRKAPEWASGPRVAAAFWLAPELAEAFGLA